MMPDWSVLGIAEEVPAAFGITNTTFDHGNEQEWHDGERHFIPATLNIWRVGDRSVREVLLSNSVLEMLAFLALHRSRYPSLGNVGLVSFGNLPSTNQLQWTRSYFSRPRYTLLFGTDPMASLIDIRVACGLKGKSARFRWVQGRVLVEYKERASYFDLEQISLFSFERIFGVRSGLRTRKPAKHSTFLEQLRSMAVNTDR
ncbi:hypothetical protein ABDD95_12475 [Mucilaginibacter sp. PAMB04274]|uniref:hypothetical protein n=1 Tax=Mucilaginibacter sp. PAMB04274 TaxID=3138568 RepID=UPI0031F68E88